MSTGLRLTNTGTSTGIALTSAGLGKKSPVYDPSLATWKEVDIAEGAVSLNVTFGDDALHYVGLRMDMSGNLSLVTIPPSTDTFPIDSTSGFRASAQKDLLVGMAIKRGGTLQDVDGSKVLVVSFFRPGRVDLFKNLAGSSGGPQVAASAGWAEPAGNKRIEFLQWQDRAAIVSAKVGLNNQTGSETLSASFIMQTPISTLSPVPGIISGRVFSNAWPDEMELRLPMSNYVEGFYSIGLMLNAASTYANIVPAWLADTQLIASVEF